MTTSDFLGTKAAAQRSARQYHVVQARAEEVRVADGAVDHVVCDPGYSEHTQANVRRGKRAKADISVPVELTFEAATTVRMLQWADKIATATRRWALVKSDHEGSHGWRVALERAGMEYVRSMPWIRTGDWELGPEQPAQSGTPQMTGDRPSVGHEIIVLAHRRGVRKRWNGGGKHGVYTAAVMRGEHRFHPTQKPLALLLQLLEDFCNPGETIWDPFCGSGTTLAAAKQLGMFAVGSDYDPKCVDYTRRRVALVGKR